MVAYEIARFKFLYAITRRAHLRKLNDMNDKIDR